MTDKTGLYFQNAEKTHCPLFYLTQPWKKFLKTWYGRSEHLLYLIANFLCASRIVVARQIFQIIRIYPFFQFFKFSNRFPLKNVFNLFPGLKKFLGGKRFEKLKERVNSYLENLAGDYYVAGIEKLIRYNKCLGQRGDYVKK